MRELSRDRESEPATPITMSRRWIVLPIEIEDMGLVGE
jgi:hypothetical protein